MESWGSRREDLSEVRPGIQGDRLVLGQLRVAPPDGRGARYGRVRVRSPSRLERDRFRGKSSTIPTHHARAGRPPASGQFRQRQAAWPKSDGDR